jgi:hypothetical protein
MSLITISEKQLAANRRNAAKSTGPQSDSGKARSSLNALKHGRYSVTAPLLRGEDSQAFNELLHAYVLRFQPQDPVEMGLVRKLASADWRLSRFMAIESRAIDLAMTESASPYLPAKPGVLPYDEDVTKALGAKVDQSKFPRFLGDRQRQLTQTFDSTLRQLSTLRAQFKLAAPHSEPIDSEDTDLLKPAQNEPISNPQPDDSINGTNPFPDAA